MMKALEERVKFPLFQCYFNLICQCVHYLKQSDGILINDLHTRQFSSSVERIAYIELKINRKQGQHTTSTHTPHGFNFPAITAVSSGGLGRQDYALPIFNTIRSEVLDACHKTVNLAYN